MSAPAGLSAELEALRAATARMAEVVGHGGLVDLSALEDSVSAFCARVNALPAGEGRALRSGLIALMDDLGRLDGLMRAARDDAVRRLGETAQRRRATLAYGNTPTRK